MHRLVNPVLSKEQEENLSDDEKKQYRMKSAGELSHKAMKALHDDYKKNYKESDEFENTVLDFTYNKIYDNIKEIGLENWVNWMDKNILTAKDKIKEMKLYFVNKQNYEKAGNLREYEIELEKKLGIKKKY